MKRLGFSGKRSAGRGLPETWAPEREKQVTREGKQRKALIDQSGIFGQQEEE